MPDFNKEEIEKLSIILRGHEVDTIALEETHNDSFLVITLFNKTKVSFRYDWIYDFSIDTGGK